MPKASSPKSCSRSSTVEEGAEAILNLAVSDELSGSGFRRKPRVQDADLPLPFFITTDIGRDSLPAGQARVAWRRDTALDLGDPVCARVDGRWRDEEAGRGTACSMLTGGRSCGMMMPLS